MGLAGLLLVGMVTAADVPQLSRVETSVDQELKHSLTFNVDTAPYEKSKMWFTKIDSNKTRGLRTEAVTEKPVGKSISFKIPLAHLADAEFVELETSLIDSSDQVIWRAPSTSVTFSAINESRKQKDALTTLESKLKQSEADNTRKDGIIASIVAKSQARQINYTGSPKFLSDVKVILQFDLDVVGVVRGTIRSTDAQPSIAPRTLDSAASDHPILRFDGLSERGNYEIVASIVDISDGKETDKKVRVAIQAKSRVNDLALTDLKLVPEDEKLKLTFTANQSGFVEIKYAEAKDTFEVGTPETLKQMGLDVFENPTGDAIKEGTNIFYLDRVKPGKKYMVTINGMNAFGKRMPGAISTSNAVMVEPIKLLAFDPGEPVAADISPLNVTLSWKASQKPKIATFAVIIDRDTVASRSTEQFTDDLKISLQLPADQIVKLFTTTNDPSKPKPKFRASMIDAKTGQTIFQDIRFVYTLPTQAEVTKAADNNQINKQTKDDLIDVIKNAKQNKKVDWSKLVSTGLSILTAVL